MVTVIEKAMVVGQVKQFVNSNQMFTAFDVTKELRQSDPDVKHYIVREAVADIFTNDDTMLDYTRTLVDLPGKGSAFVYHDVNSNPIDYVDSFGTPTPAAIPIFRKPTVTIKTFKDHSFTWPKNLIPLSRDGRINLPIKMLNRINVGANDKIVVYLENNNLIVEKFDTQSVMKSEECSIYKVFDAGNVQVSKKLTSLIGDAFLDEFTIKMASTGDQLIISVA